MKTAQVETTEAYVDHYLLGKTTVAIVSVLVKNDETKEQEVIKFSGTARCEGPDKYDPTIGVNLSTGRAFEKLGKYLQGQANGHIKHHDDMKAQKLRQERRKQAREAAKQAPVQYSEPKEVTFTD